jgi:hypothetical protein
MAERYQAWCEKNAERGGGERRGKWHFLSAACLSFQYCKNSSRASKI